MCRVLSRTSQGTPAPCTWERSMLRLVCPELRGFRVLGPLRRGKTWAGGSWGVFQHLLGRNRRFYHSILPESVSSVGSIEMKAPTEVYDYFCDSGGISRKASRAASDVLSRGRRPAAGELVTGRGGGGGGGAPAAAGAAAGAGHAGRAARLRRPPRRQVSPPTVGSRSDPQSVKDAG